MEMFDKWDWMEALINDNKTNCSGWGVHITSGPVGTQCITPTIKEYDSVYADNKKENTNMKAIPEIKKVAFDDAKHNTTIVWGDGKHTTVTNTSGNPDDHYAGFCAAVCKKLFGSTSAVIKTMHTFDVDEVARRKKAERIALAAKEDSARKNIDEFMKKERQREFNDLVNKFILEEEARQRARDIVACRAEGGKADA